MDSMGEANFGKYRLIAELGHGGMADVFLAVMAGPAGSGFSKLTVVKRLRQNLAEEPEFVEMLVDEARISARLNHPNVVQTNEVGSVGNVYFLAMEYLDGQPFHRIQHRAAQAAQKARAEGVEAAAVEAAGEAPLSTALLSTDPFPKECQYLVLLDTLAGLHHAHELADYDGSSLQIVHRDVTPHNVFVTYEGQVKVVDFGIAKAAGRASETRQGVVKGKVRYMAPEQALGMAVDRRADIFSVGVMLWEAATGRRLWKDMDDLNIVQALVGGHVKSSPRELVPDVPQEIDRICKKALAHSRDDRYATAEEFRLDLEQYLAESGTLVPARRKIGAAVSALFNDKRAEIRAVIEKQLQALKGRTSTEIKPVHIPLDSTSGSSFSGPLPSGQGVAVSVIPPVANGDVAMGGADSASLRVAVRGGAGKGFKTRVAVLGGAGVLVLGVVALAAGRNASPLATGAVPTVTPPTPPTPTPETPSVPDHVRIKLKAVPSSARITIDGAPVSSPYEASVPRDARERKIQVEAPGFESQSETVKFDSDVAMVLTLKSSAHSPAPRWTPPVVKPSPGPREVAAPPPVAVAPTPPPPPATSPPAPLGPTKVAKPEIDKGDPWAKGH
jgi:serine/threonine-protein kinase